MRLGEVRATTRPAIAHEVAAAIAARPGPVRVAVDGAPPAEPVELAGMIAVGLRARGRAALVVRAADFLRPASVRLEHGRQDEEMFLDGWLDDGALRREVLDPLPRTGRVLPRLWDAGRDRAFRAEYTDLGTTGVVLLAGALLLGRGLPIDLAVHLRMGATALRRRMPAEELWTVPVFERYERERDPAGEAEIVILTDHPERPAVRGSAYPAGKPKRKSGRGGS